MVPPFNAVAVKLTLVPEHMAPLGIAAMLMLAVTGEVTAIVIEFEVAGEPVAQAKEEVIIQVMIFPFASEEDEYVELVAPEIFEPLFCH